MEMGSDASNTAIILFTRSRAEEAKAKDFSMRHSMRTNSRIAGSLISHAEQTARKSGLPSFVIDSHHQTGSCFGERLANAFETIYHIGYDQVIAIGNDCPTLTPDDLRLAAAQLHANGIVFGPSGDGGVYFIGMQRSAYQRERFVQLPWCSADLIDALYGYGNTSVCNIACMPEKNDVDFGQQLIAALLSDTYCLRLYTAVLSWINGFHCIYAYRNPFRQLALLIGTSGLRAPPAL